MWRDGIERQDERILPRAISISSGCGVRPENAARPLPPAAPPTGSEPQ